jgi:membrane-associated phospholipid phosphatase
MSVLYEFGEYGPLILLIISWCLLWNSKNLFFYFNIGVFINVIINIILKGLIQEPRPVFDTKKVSLAKTHAKELFYKSGIPFDMFGMPSCHAQTAFYITMFTYLCFQKSGLLYFYLPFSLFICYQRYHLNYHSISQLIVGSTIGSIIGYIMYQLARDKIKGKIREKPDDNAPV